MLISLGTWVLDVENLGRNFLVMSFVSKARVSADGFAFEPEDVRNCATSEGDKSKERAGPFVSKAVIHLLGEKDTTRTPERSETSLRGQGRCRLVLVSVDYRHQYSEHISILPTAYLPR
jgi:hypothetical protein